jgi:hypothetical protein
LRTRTLHFDIRAAVHEAQYREEEGRRGEGDRSGRRRLRRIRRTSKSTGGSEKSNAPLDLLVSKCVSITPSPGRRIAKCSLEEAFLLCDCWAISFF